MKSKNDFLLDYFNKKKKNFLRGFLYFILIFFVIISFLSFNDLKKDYIAKISIDEIILNNENLLSSLDELLNDENLRAVVVKINSPGGTVVGSQKLYNKLTRIGEKVPIAISMQEVAASGGYMVSLAGERIFSHDGTITGSVGVILQSANITNLLSNLGIDPLIVKSGKLKSSPNPLEKTTDDSKKSIQRIIDDMHKQFLELVIKKRNLNQNDVLKISDGRVFTGLQAKEINLVDEIGDEQDAVNWMKEKLQLDDSIEIKKIGERKKYDDILNLKSFDRLKVTFNGIYALWLPNYE